MLTIESIQNAVAHVAPQYPIRRVSLFGSYADGKANEESDVDLLVEFQQPTVSLFDVLGFEEQMREVLHVHVDAIQYPVLKPFDPDFAIHKTVMLYGQ